MKLIKPFVMDGDSIKVDDAGDLRPGDIVNVEQESMLVMFVDGTLIGVVSGYLARFPHRESKNHEAGTEVILAFRDNRGGAL